MYIIFLGAPGAGKGTQSKRIMAKYGLPQISTGDMLRTEISNGTRLGKKVKSILSNGELVSDDLMLKIVERRLSQDDCRNGFILDGFPRTIPQAEGLEVILARLGSICIKLIEISVPDEEIVRRLTSRRTCSDCGKVYNVTFQPPPEDNLCTNCNGEIIQRKDDTEETIRHRLEIYKKSTKPLVEYYAKQHHFGQIDGTQPVDDVFAVIESILDAKSVRVAASS